MADNQKYVVAKGCSFVGNKKAYKEGDEIDESAFSKPEYFKKMLGGKNPRIVPAPAEEKKDTSAAEKAAAEKRKGYEELAMSNNLLKKEQLSAVKDEELEGILKKAGLIK